MGLLNAKKPIKKIPPKGVKKPLVKKELKPIKEETVEPIVEEVKVEIEQQDIIEEDVEIQENKEIDVNEDEKIDLSIAENMENEKISETENSEEIINTDELPTIDKVVESEVKEEKQTKRKVSKKKNKTKTENIIVDDSSEKITTLEEADEYMSGIVLSSEEWEEEKEGLSNEMGDLLIEPDLNPDELKKLLSRMSKFQWTLRQRKVDAKTSYDAITKQINDIKTLNSVGSNAETRKINAAKAVLFYKRNPEDKTSIDLEQYALAIKNKIEFYTSCLETSEYNRQLLITFASAFKLEINTYQ